MRIIILLTLYFSLTVSAETWEVLHRCSLPSKVNQPQDVVWNNNSYLAESFRESEDSLEAWSLNGNIATKTQKEINGHQGVDYANGNYFKFNADNIQVYSDRAGLFSLIKTINLAQPALASGNIDVNTTGDRLPDWSTWSGATDGRYAVTVSFANVYGDNRQNIKNYTHVFLYHFNTSQLPENNVTLHPFRSFHIAPEYSRYQYIQGAEIVNDMIYIQLGGLHNYDNDYKNVILEYTIDGVYQQTHEFEANRTIATGSIESIFPSYLHVEFEGLMEINGKIYSQVYYNYGWGIFPLTHKTLVYEAIDSTRTMSHAQPRRTELNR